MDILSAKFGSDILLLDLQGLTIIADYFVIASGDSVRQLDAMAEDLRKQLNGKGNIWAFRGVAGVYHSATHWR